MNTLLLFILPLFQLTNTMFFDFDNYFNRLFENNEYPYSKNMQYKGDTIADDLFPKNTEITPYKINVNKNENNQLEIILQTQGLIESKNISTQKTSQYIKIEINLDCQSYFFILEEKKLSIASNCQQILRNSKNTQYSSSSSSISRQEILPHHIDLNSVKMNIKKDSGLVTIIAQYKDPNQNKQEIEVEFE